MSSPVAFPRVTAPLRVVAPSTSKVLFKVVAPSTSKPLKHSIPALLILTLSVPPVVIPILLVSCLKIPVSVSDVKRNAGLPAVPLEPEIEVVAEILATSRLSIWVSPEPLTLNGAKFILPLPAPIDILNEFAPMATALNTIISTLAPIPPPKVIKSVSEFIMMLLSLDLNILVSTVQPAAPPIFAAATVKAPPEVTEKLSPMLIAPAADNIILFVVLLLKLIAPLVIWTLDLLAPTSPITVVAPNVATALLAWPS